MNKPKRAVKGKEPWRNISIKKQCVVCRRKYHPRKGAHPTKNFCSTKCFQNRIAASKPKREVKGKESWRDLSITKKCATCGIKYHPRKNGYQDTSKYCSAICFRRDTNKGLDL